MTTVTRLFVCFCVGIKPENLYFASRRGLEVKPRLYEFSLTVTQATYCAEGVVTVTSPLEA